MRRFDKTTMGFSAIWVVWGLVSVGYTGSVRGVFIPAVVAWLVFCGVHWLVFMLVPRIT